MGAIVAVLLPLDNAYKGVVSFGCGFLAVGATIFAWAGFWSWLGLRHEMNALLRGEALARWRCPEPHWKIIDPKWKEADPPGEICIAPNSIYAGSEARSLLFVDWRSRRHLSVVEMQGGDPILLRMEVSVPSSGRIPGYAIPILLPVPPEKRDDVAAAVEALRNSDAIRPKGQSYTDFFLLLAIVAALGAAILQKLGFLRW